MDAKIVPIAADEITDWASFHDVFKETLGFPGFYGRNMNAWIDCMTSLDAPEDGLAAVAVQPGELVVLRIDGADRFAARCPEQYEALVECSAFVNHRRIAVGEPPVLALTLAGWFRHS